MVIDTPQRHETLQTAFWRVLYHEGGVFGFDDTLKKHLLNLRTGGLGDVFRNLEKKGCWWCWYRCFGRGDNDDFDDDDFEEDGPSSSSSSSSRVVPPPGDQER